MQKKEESWQVANMRFKQKTKEDLELFDVLHLLLI